MVLKFLEDKALIPSVPSLSKNPLLQKFKWNPKQNGGDLGESKNAMHTLESAREKSFHPQTLKSKWAEKKMWMMTRPCQWGSFCRGHRTWGDSELPWTTLVTAQGGQGRWQAQRKDCSEPPSSLPQPLWNQDCTGRMDAAFPCHKHTLAELQLCWAQFNLNYSPHHAKSHHAQSITVFSFQLLLSSSYS